MFLFQHFFSADPKVLFGEVQAWRIFDPLLTTLEEDEVGARNR